MTHTLPHLWRASLRVSTDEVLVAHALVSPSDEDVLSVVKRVVLALNKINEQHVRAGQMGYETGEREELCEYTDASLGEAGIDVEALTAQAAPAPGTTAGAGQPAVEVDRVVPASGNVWIGGQQVWLGPALSGRKITLWVDAISLHVLLDGARIKTLPSRLGATELARLAAHGARLAGPSPLPTGDGR